MNSPATTFDPIPWGAIPLPADIASWALIAKGGTTTHAMDAIAYSVAAHRHGDTHHLRWDAMLNDTLGDYRTYATNYVSAHFADNYSNFYDGFTFDQLTMKDATLLLANLVELATRQLPESASGTATIYATEENGMIAIKNDERDDHRMPLSYDFTHDEIAAHAKAARGTTDQDVIDTVAWLAATELLVGHHPLIPFYEVRDDIADMLRASSSKLNADERSQTWDWDMMVHFATLTADENLFRGTLYAKAESDGTATTRTRVGQIITERAARRIWAEGTEPAQRVAPDGMRRYEALRDEERAIMANALAFIAGYTGNAPEQQDESALDKLDDTQAKALLDHLAIFTTAPGEPSEH
ncbi:hypothetical protein [Nonomuraea basaltis]|uniref:hypothetical protein n=1 Tax=Nonomuraea basaltis TaxID=2495887 RepID=UPI00110C6D43|nr:hypothetical protein [Nonomuraea basaltis]TMR99592.1 hypothetical protein EJK15_07195 [Nonomuraea basaltis]